MPSQSPVGRLGTLARPTIHQCQHQVPSASSSPRTEGPPDLYGVVPKGLLTFLGTLIYKEVVKTAPGTLVYCFKRQTARKKKISIQKHYVLNLDCKIFSQEPSDSFILCFNVIFPEK